MTREQPMAKTTQAPSGREVFLGASLQDLGSVGPHTLNVIDEETERIVEEAKTRRCTSCGPNWVAVQETARALLEHETLSGVALDAVLSTVDEIEMGDPAAGACWTTRHGVVKPAAAL
jgi:cell division protease FtsH